MKQAAKDSLWIHFIDTGRDKYRDKWEQEKGPQSESMDFVNVCEDKTQMY